MLVEPAIAPTPRAATTGLLPLRPAGSWLASRPRHILLGVAAAVASLLVGALGAWHLKDGIALVVGLGIIVAVLLRPFLGGLILVGLVPVISGLAPGMPIPSVRASEALIGLIGVTLMVTARRQDAVPWDPVDWLLLAYGLGWTVFGVYNASVLGQHMSLSTWGTVIGQLQFFLIYRGVRLAIRTPRERRLAVKVLLGASVPVAMLAILQMLHVPGVDHFLVTITSGSTPGTATAPGSNATSVAGNTDAAMLYAFHRATGPFDNWTSLAGYLFPILVLLGALALAGQARRRWRAFVVVTGLSTVALFLTAELSALIGLLAAVLALGVVFRRTPQVLRWLLIALVATAAVLGPYIGKRLSNEFGTAPTTHQSAIHVPQTIQYRGYVWTGQYFPAIGARPLTGYGVNLPATIRWPYTESQYVTLLMEGGVPVLLLFAALMWATIRKGGQTARSPDPFDQAVGRAVVVGVGVLVVMDVVWPYMSNGGLPQLLWALVAIAAPVAVPRSSPAPAGLDKISPAPAAEP